jgi:hypothetical protein
LVLRYQATQDKLERRFRRYEQELADLQARYELELSTRVEALIVRIEQSEHMSIARQSAPGTVDFTDELIRRYDALDRGRRARAHR